MEGKTESKKRAIKSKEAIIFFYRHTSSWPTPAASLTKQCLMELRLLWRVNVIKCWQARGKAVQANTGLMLR